MAKKRRKAAQRGKRQSQSKEMTSEQRAHEAQQALEQGRYRQAIEHFKALLKQQSCLEWRHGLAQAYAGRATALAAKGMHKEALVIWQNRQRLGADVAQVTPDQIDALLRLGQTVDALEATRTLQGQSPAQQRHLAGKIGAHYLAGDTQLAEALAPDDPVRQHGDQLQQALQAYVDGDDDGVESALAGIPFRSPYRDLVQLIKVLQQLETDPHAATALLDKVPTDTPFVAVRHAVVTALLPESRQFEALGRLSDSARRFAMTLCGWGQERQALYARLKRLGPAPSIKQRIDALFQLRQSLGEAWVQDQAMRLACHDIREGIQHLAKWCPKLPSAYLQRRLYAWCHETQDADPWEIHDAWESFVEALERERTLSPGSDDALRAALTLRRVDQRFHCLDATPSQDPDRLDHAAAQQLERSLEYDPDDVATYLRLHDYYLRGKLLKEARRLENAALEHWPHDIKVLTAALDTALASGAFKKAAGLAGRILQYDPINRGARDRLVKAHLAHAVKQISAARTDLAQGELRHAAYWDRSGDFLLRRRILDALCEYRAEPERGVERIQEIHQEQQQSASAQLLIVHEALLTGLTLHEIQRQLTLEKPKVHDPEDLQRLMAQLKDLPLGSSRRLQDLHRHFASALKKAAKLPLTITAMEQACELWQRLEWHDIQLAFARSALKQWRKAPVFILHEFVGRYPTRHWLATDDELDRLEIAAERAREAGDMRVHQRLRSLIQQASPMDFFNRQLAELIPPEEEDHDPDNAPVDVDQMLRDLEQHGVDAVCDALQIDRKTRKMLRRIESELGKRGVAQLLMNMILDNPID
ncbi:MAG: hypothetical protein U5L98_06065 [Halomonas sp.]|uniref:hypothetical protein n=1 Tax=Halomonas sp. TaxID=1486246 RepID=UPI002ACEBE42|nr:hypothetical protein [Halomonas sp.]MDZ7852215.1 hypothetical protein [Halomonas sp.]